jgi:hypothetical protein
MQTLMELIKTCINKELNTNSSDVSPNASPNVLIVEAITKALVFTTVVNVFFLKIHSQQELKANNFMALHNLKAQKIMVALCLQEGKEIVITCYRRPCQRMHKRTLT